MPAHLTVSQAFAIVALVSSSACMMATPSEPELDIELAQRSLALTTSTSCPRPSLGRGNSCALAEGKIRFQVTLPSGQAYVELFARQNGLQNLATNIVG